MILYKYISDERGRSVIEHGKVAFSLARYFNDPFETEAGYPVPQIDPVSDLMNGIQAWGKREIWARNSGVLCLTRSPHNPLMWAHYAEEHRGLVLGFDAEKAGFLSEQTCLIPAQFGSVIYTHTRPTHPLPLKERAEPIKVGQEHRFRSDHYDKLSQLFLQKPACWSYEEEVRIVKCVSGIEESGVNHSGAFEVHTSKNNDGSSRNTYLYRLPKGAIKRVILGLRHPLLDNGDKLLDFLDSLRAIHPDVEVTICEIARDTWDLESRDADDYVKHRTAPREVIGDAAECGETEMPEEN